MVSEIIKKNLEGLVKRNSRDFRGGSLVKSGNDNSGFVRNAIIDAEVVKDKSFSCRNLRNNLRNKTFNNHLFYIPAVIGALALGLNYGGCASKSEEPTIVANSNNPVEMQSFSNNSNQNQPRRVYSSGVLTAGSNLNSADLALNNYQKSIPESLIYDQIKNEMKSQNSNVKYFNNLERDAVSDSNDGLESHIKLSNQNSGKNEILGKSNEKISDSFPKSPRYVFRERTRTVRDGSGNILDQEKTSVEYSKTIRLEPLPSLNYGERK